ncbi:MAG: GNAT family N-acetyltransferase [Pseudomonadota bacterium]
MTIPALTARFHASIDEIPAKQWNALVPASTPHLQHVFLAHAERSGSVSEATGWLPCHLGLYADDALVAAMPLYQKGHSWGEFVFDWSWADAYRRAGLSYYPKLLSAAPYTPATSSKLLVDSDHPDADELRRTLLSAALQFATEQQFSSLHLQFMDATDEALCREANLIIRQDCQFHWHNEDYTSFEHFLGHFSSKKRKNVKRERRRVIESGITHTMVTGGEITETQMRDAWRLCSYTFAARGGEPYLNLDFFLTLLKSDPSLLVLALAQHEERHVAAAILLREGDALLGRYWGSEGDYHSLHFETCYYQGIEYCIKHGIQRYEPGTQGEHKVSRGFLPTSTRSAHWLAHPQFAAAIEDYVDREALGVEQYMQDINERTPFRRGEVTVKSQRS